MNATTQDAPTVEHALESLLAWMVQAEEELGAPLTLGYRAKVQKPVVIARARDALKAENAALQATSTAKRGSPFIRQLKDENARLKEALSDLANKAGHVLKETGILDDACNCHLGAQSCDECDDFKAIHAANDAVSTARALLSQATP